MFVGAIIGLSLRQQLMAGTLSNLSAPDIPIDADHKLQQASEDGLRGDFSSAVRLATEVIDQQPNNVMAYLLRGTAYRRNGEHLQAIADLDRAIELDSMSSLAYTQRAFSHQQNSTSGASKLILEDLHRAIELDASNALAHILRGNELAEAKQFDAAIADYDRAAQLNPRSFAALAGRASSKLGLGQLDEARRDLENALKLNPPVGDRRQIEALLQYAVSRSNTDDPDRDGTFVRRE
jgi:tetratricopeptide (TPR) repeat protein